MTLSLAQNTTAVGPGGVPVPFTGRNGTPPYSYAVLAGGVGGSINATTGLYRSPIVMAHGKNIDIVQVTDSATPTHHTATAEILVGDAMDLLCEIIQKEMGLADGRCWQFYGKNFQPHDSGLFIPVKFLPLKAFGNTRKAFPILHGGMADQQVVYIKGLADIHLKSRDVSARDRKEDLLFALTSRYAQSQQHLNSFKIYNIPTGFVDLSSEDGAAIPFHFVISVAMTYYKAKTTEIAYFDKFDTVSVVAEP